MDLEGWILRVYLFIYQPVFLQSTKTYFNSLYGRQFSFKKWHTVFKLAQNGRSFIYLSLQNVKPLLLLTRGTTDL